jgi:hypothetical protein
MYSQLLKYGPTTEGNQADYAVTTLVMRKPFGSVNLKQFEPVFEENLQNTSGLFLGWDNQPFQYQATCPQ